MVKSVDPQALHPHSTAEQVIQRSLHFTSLVSGCPADVGSRQSLRCWTAFQTEKSISLRTRLCMRALSCSPFSDCSTVLTPCFLFLVVRVAQTATTIQRPAARLYLDFPEFLTFLLTLGLSFMLKDIWEEQKLADIGVDFWRSMFFLCLSQRFYYTVSCFKPWTPIVIHFDEGCPKQLCTAAVRKVTLSTERHLARCLTKTFNAPPSVLEPVSWAEAVQLFPISALFTVSVIWHYITHISPALTEESTNFLSQRLIIQRPFFYFLNRCTNVLFVDSN